MITLTPLNLGTYDNDGAGDSLKVGGQKINANFSALAPLFTAKGQASNQDYVYPDEFDANLVWDVSWNSSYDASPAIKAMLAQALVDGRQPALRPNRRYYNSQKLVVDPSRQGLEGNGAVLDFSLKTFTNPASNPELLSDPDFDTGTPWIVSPNEQNGGTAGVAPTYSGSDLIWNTPDGVLSYLEVGQQVTCPAGSRLQITITFDEITTRSYGPNTYRDSIVSLRAPVSGQSDAYSIGNGGNASGGANMDLSNQSSTYLAGTPATFTGQLTTSVANPYLRIQSNAQVRIASASVKVVPDNTCILVQVPAAGNLRGHNYHEFCNFKVAGNPNGAAYVDAFEFDTLVSGYASRTMFRNLDVSDNIGRCMLFRNRVYLNVFQNCRMVASNTCLETFPGSQDAGENIAFFGGNFGGGITGIKNTGGFTLHMFGVSIDFSRQWYAGAGGMIMQGCWLELNSPTVVGYPLIDVTGGYCCFRDTRIQVDGATTAVLTSSFRVASGAYLDIEADVPYNLHGTSGALCEGLGRFRFIGRGGANKEMDAITKRDDLHNRFGSGAHFEGNSININAWMACGGGFNNSRYQCRFPALQTFTGDVFTGCDVIYNTSISPTSALLNKIVTNVDAAPGTRIRSVQASAAGFTANFNNGQNTLSSVSPAPTASVGNNRFIQGTGLRPGTRIITYSNSGATITLSDSQASAATGVSFTVPNAVQLSQPWNGLSATGITISTETANPEVITMSTSADYAYTGTQSLKMLKGQVGQANCVVYLAFPIDSFRAVGAEFLYKIPPQGSGSYTVYFQSYFAKVSEVIGSYIPQLSDLQLITDQNSGSVDLSQGKDWTRLVFSSNRIDASSAHDGYSCEMHTHVVIAINITSTPSGFVMYVDDLFGNMM